MKNLTYTKAQTHALLNERGVIYTITYFTEVDLWVVRDWIIFHSNYPDTLRDSVLLIIDSKIADNATL